MGASLLSMLEGKKSTLFPAIKFVQLPPQAANPALILSRTVLGFILDFFCVLNTAGRCSYLGNSGGMLRGGRAALRQTPFGKVGMERWGLLGPEPLWKFQAGVR